MTTCLRESHHCSICGLNMVSNFIRCKTCNLYVHHESSSMCIGAKWVHGRLGDEASAIMNGDVWECQSCASGNDTVCLFCFTQERSFPNSTAASDCPWLYKLPIHRTKSQWVHALCAYANNVHVNDKKKKNEQRACEHCRGKDFRLVKCSNQKCSQVVHPSCAWNRGNLCVPTYSAKDDSLWSHDEGGDLLQSTFSVNLLCENCTKKAHPTIGSAFVLEQRRSVCHFFELDSDRHVTVNMSLEPLDIEGHVPVHVWRYKWVWNTTLYGIEELLDCTGVDFINEPKEPDTPFFCLSVTIDESSGAVPRQWELLVSNATHLPIFLPSINLIAHNLGDSSQK